MNVRTRFAPSPTGFLHVGAARTALFAWLVARQAGGQFILRIEDTDKAREVVGAENHIKDSLKWLGINWDEGPDAGGEFEPYRQSERLDIYKQWAQKLIDSGRAYADPYTKEQLEQFRLQAKQAKKPFLFREFRPEKRIDWDGSQPLRFKSEPKKYDWHDEVLGNLSAGPEAIDDFILMKSDGYPTYNFCHIIDDALMQISHVIRSQEFISSVPKFLNLYEALQIKPPILATLPYVMAIDGHKKLSKRDGAKDILDYAREGYLPETLLNFLATLGWNDGSEQEIFNKDELIQKFKLERVQKSAARFDEKRLVWMNGQWIRKLELNDFFQRSEQYLPKQASNFDKEYLLKVLGLAQDRLKTLSELPKLTSFFFEEPKPDLTLIKEDKNLGKLDNRQIDELIQLVIDNLKDSDFSKVDLSERLNALLESTGQKPPVLFGLIRVATTWSPFSPELFGSLSLIGKDKTLSRLKQCQHLFK